MPSIYGYSNGDLDFYNMGGSVDTNPAASGFDANVTKTVLDCSFLPREGWRMYLTDQNWGGAARAGLRYQFLHYTDATASANSFASYSGQWVTFVDILSGREVFRIANLSGGGGGTSLCQLQYNSATSGIVATWVNIGAPALVPAGLSTHTITILIANSGGMVQWHMNGALMASMLGDTLVTPSTTIDCISLYGWGSSGTGRFRNKFGEFVLASEDYMTYGMRVVDGQITAAGTHAGQVSGIFSDINELALNTANGITFDTALQKASFQLSDLAGVVAAAPIMEARVTASVRRGAAGPQQVKLGILDAGGQQLSPTIPLAGIGFTTVAARFPFDSLGAPFSPSVYNGSQVVIEAET